MCCTEPSTNAFLIFFFYLPFPNVSAVRIWSADRTFAGRRIRDERSAVGMENRNPYSYVPTLGTVFMCHRGTVFTVRWRRSQGKLLLVVYGDDLPARTVVHRFAFRATILWRRARAYTSGYSSRSNLSEHYRPAVVRFVSIFFSSYSCCLGVFSPLREIIKDQHCDQKMWVFKCNYYLNIVNFQFIPRAWMIIFGQEVMSY
jgi:hypothetical protein